jgi:hypothetical protein
MRLFKLPAPILALILSVLAESLFFLVTRLVGILGYTHLSTLQDFWFQWYIWLHLPAAEFTEILAKVHFIPHNTTLNLLLFVSVFQWWLIFLFAIWILRRFHKKHHEKRAA